MKKKAEEKKKEIRNNLARSISKERGEFMRNYSADERKAMISNLKVEQNLRKEIGVAMKGL